MKLGPLHLTWRSYTDRFLGELGPIFDEARSYLEAEGIADTEQAELAKLIIIGDKWLGYEWIEASVYGRARHGIGAYDPVHEHFRLLSACLVTFGFRQLIPTFSDLEGAATLEEFTELLITKNPGSRDLPIGLNALSGLCALMELHRMIMRGWNNFHLAGFVHTDLRSLSAHAKEGEDLLLQAQIRTQRGGQKSAETRREEEWLPRQARIKDAVRRFKAQGTPPHKLASAVSEATGIPVRTVRRHIKNPTRKKANN